MSTADFNSKIMEVSMNFIDADLRRISRMMGHAMSIQQEIELGREPFISIYNAAEFQRRKNL